MSGVLSALLGVTLGALIAPVTACLWTLIFRQRPGLRWILTGWMLGDVAGGTSAAINHDWALAAGAGGSLIVAVAIWWWRRKKRRNVAALLGAKSRALRDALVRRVRDSGTPRQVLRPVPQGAA